MSENEDCKNHNVEQSSPVRRKWNFYQLYRMDKEIDDIKTQLLECETEYEHTEIEIYNFDQLKNKGTYVLKNVERQYNNLDEELRGIHSNYIKCIEKVNFTNGTMQQTMDSLTLERDNLKKELDELIKTADENNKKLMEIEKMITIQEVHSVYIYYINSMDRIFMYIYL
ncbi:PREDICTED: uncharacterized protein LOC108547154 [Eufriesea mexicana]|uniref:uncharacterized protein LOC108547154 n=1 Tax=Eufriesea mexicana TaxID=516756 RepID=UPI00083C0A5A|nr:PREDICTED: uncharacterized protein LOC108547154 [Eufriesea mexicana]